MKTNKNGITGILSKTVINDDLDKKY